MERTTDFMYVTIVTEDNTKKSLNKMYQSQETTKDPGAIDNGKAKNKRPMSRLFQLRRRWKIKE